MIKIIIAEDISKLALAMKEKIEFGVEFKVTGISSNGKELIERLEQNHAVDVVIIDINMPEMNGIEATNIVTSRWPNIKVIMSTIFDDEQNIFDAIMAGASGYILKDEPPEKVHRSIYEAIEGGAPMSAMIAKKALSLLRNSKLQQENSDDYKLTKRELEVLEQIAKGLSYDQISNNLFISYGTAKKHVENIYAKMKVHNKIEAIEKARKSGLL
ncbi:MAG: response regulator transcription factor [Brumimicrobium sp.]|nr:response regulator transcription factor [Brumimicrobium sp.]